MKQPKYLSLLLAGTLVLGFAPTFSSAETNTTSVVNEAAPAAPVVSAPLHTSTSLVIKGEAGLKAEIMINGKVYVRTIQSSGEATFTMSAQSVGKIIDVRLVNASNVASEVTRVIVAEDAAARPSTPVLKPVTNSSRILTVQGEPGLSLVLTVGNTTYSGKFDANGTYRRTISLQKVGTPITVQAKSSKGALSNLVSKKVVADKIAPKPGRVTKAITTTSIGVAGTAEPYATAIVTIGSKTYTAPVMSTGKFVVKIPKQTLGQKMSLVIRDGAGNRSTPTAITVQHALYHNFHRVNLEGARLVLHKEVFYSDAAARYDATFAPVFFNHPSKANMYFLLNHITEDGEPIEFEKFTVRVGTATYSQKISFDDIGYAENEDGSVEESYVFKPNSKLIAFVKQNVRPDKRIVVKVEGYEYDIEWALTGGDKRAFIQSLQYAGY